MPDRPGPRWPLAGTTLAGVTRAAATLAGVTLVGVTLAAWYTAAEPSRVDHIARGHGVAHDARAVAAITRWVALGSPTGVSAAGGAMAQAEPVDRTVTLTTEGSNLEFVPAQLSLKTGTRVRVEYVNNGVLPHNFVVLRDEDDLDALGIAAYDAEATGFVPTDQQDRLIAYTTLAAPGETVSVTFVVPAPGEYTFVCLFPGHYNVMLGTLRALR